MAPNSPSGDDDLERLLREVQELNAEAEAVMRGEDAKQTPAKRDDAVAKRSGSSPDTNDSDEGSGGGRLTRALVVSAVSAALVFLVFGVFLFGITSWLLPELLVWAVAAFAGGMGVAGYYTWRHRE